MPPTSLIHWHYRTIFRCDSPEQYTNTDREYCTAGWEARERRFSMKWSFSARRPFCTRVRFAILPYRSAPKLIRIKNLNRKRAGKIWTAQLPRCHPPPAFRAIPAYPDLFLQLGKHHFLPDPSNCPSRRAPHVSPPAGDQSS